MVVLALRLGVKKPAQCLFLPLHLNTKCYALRAHCA